MKRLTQYLLLATCLCAAPALAQDKDKPAAAPAAAAAPAPATDAMADPTKAPDWSKRLELAKKMSIVQPASQQVEQAAEQLAQSISPPDRPAFKAKILAAIDDKRLEQVSVDAMARTFTVPELERMIAYFSAPEARSIAEKMQIYQQLVTPEIYRMMDAAEMAARTGAPGGAAQENPAAGTAKPQ
jgi:hypothetical protein